jgi:Xaa-Pro aminopeptidase
MRAVILQKKLNELRIDAMLVTKSQNRMYLSGFTGSSGALVISEKRMALITDFRYTEQASAQASGFTIVMHGTGGYYKEIMSQAKSFGVKRMGFEASSMSVEEFSYFEASADGIELVAIKGAIEGIRVVKEANELNLIRKACSNTDKLFEYVLGIIKPGMTEKQLATEMEIWMIRNCMSPSFGTIIASGWRGALPHGRASDKVMNAGELVTLDFGGFLDYYTSDMTRTVCLGKADSKQKEIYSVVLEAQLEGVKAARAGLKGKEVDSKSRKVIESKGYGQYFGHGLGHGVGLEVHEEPRFSVTDETDIKPGMVVSVEPGIYIPGWGGVRIEDLVVITDSEAEVLYKSPKHLIEL